MKHKISAKRLSDTLFEIAKSNDSIEEVKNSIIEFDNILRVCLLYTSDAADE